MKTEEIATPRIKIFHVIIVILFFNFNDLYSQVGARCDCSNEKAIVNSDQRNVETYKKWEQNAKDKLDKAKERLTSAEFYLTAAQETEKNAEFVLNKAAKILADLMFLNGEQEGLLAIMNLSLSNAIQQGIQYLIVLYIEKIAEITQTIISFKAKIAVATAAVATAELAWNAAHLAIPPLEKDKQAAQVEFDNANKEWSYANRDLLDAKKKLEESEKSLKECLDNIGYIEIPCQECDYKTGIIIARNGNPGYCRKCENGEDIPDDSNVPDRPCRNCKDGKIIDDATKTKDCSAGQKCCETVFGSLGCTDVKKDVNNCGDCGIKCYKGQDCCNGIPTELGTDLNCYACGDVCGTGQKCCYYHGYMTCKDVKHDRNNCGSCGNECTQGQECCNGLCTDVKTDKANCGVCGNQCAPGQICCDGICTDIKSDPVNCGSCNSPCSLNQACCDGVCTDINSDVSNCGECGHQCPSGQSCINGVCTVCDPPCIEGQGCCDGECTELKTDPDNCGSCRNQCSDCQQCINGTCINKCSQDEQCCDGECSPITYEYTITETVTTCTGSNTRTFYSNTCLDESTCKLKYSHGVCIGGSIVSYSCFGPVPVPCH